MGTQSFFIPILVAVIGSLLGLAVWAFGGGALLFVGGRYIVKSPKATYWRSVGTIALAGLAAGLAAGLVGAMVSYLIPLMVYGATDAEAVLYMLALAPTLGVVALLVGLAAGLVVAWLIIKAMFAISFGKAILAWLPTLAMAVVTLPIVGMLVLDAVLVPALQQAQNLAGQANCTSSLAAMSRATAAYRAQHDGNWPPDLQSLRTVKVDDTQTESFLCPCVRGGGRPVGQTYDYFYFPPKSDADPMSIVACDIGGNHGDGSRNILFADGTFGPMSAAEFQAALADPANAAFAAALSQVEPSAGRTPNRGD